MTNEEKQVIEQARRFYSNTPKCSCQQFRLYGGCVHSIAKDRERAEQSAKVRTSEQK